MFDWISNHCVSVHALMYISRTLTHRPTYTHAVPIDNIFLANIYKVYGGKSSDRHGHTLFFFKLPPFMRFSCNFLSTYAHTQHTSADAVART